MADLPATPQAAGQLLDQAELLAAKSGRLSIFEPEKNEADGELRVLLEAPGTALHGLEQRLEARVREGFERGRLSALQEERRTLNSIQAQLFELGRERGLRLAGISHQPSQPAHDDIGEKSRLAELRDDDVPKRLADDLLGIDQRVRAVLDENAGLIARLRHRLTGESPDAHLRQVVFAGESQGMAARLMAERLASDLHRLGAVGMRYRSAAIFFARPLEVVALFKSLSPSMRAHAASAYQDRYGIGLCAAIEGTCGARAGRCLNHLLEGDAVAGGLEELLEVIERPVLRKNEERMAENIGKAMRGLSPEERRGVLGALAGHYNAASNGDAVRRLLDRHFRTEWGAGACAHLAGLPAFADAMRLHIELSATRVKLGNVIELVASRTAAERADILDAWQTLMVGPPWGGVSEEQADCLDMRGPRPRPAQPLLEMAEKRLPGEGPRDLVRALFDGTPVEVDLALIQCGFERRRGVWPGQVFLGKHAEERALLVHAFDVKHKNPGEFESRLAKSWPGRDSQIVMQLVGGGAVSLGELFFFCMEGLGTDENGLRTMLESLSPERLNQARTEYAALWRERAAWYARPLAPWLGNLDRRVMLETGGDSRFDFAELLAPRPTNPEELLAQMKRYLEHEHSAAISHALPRISAECRILEEDIGRAEQYYARHSAGIWTRDDRVHFHALVALAELDCAAARNMKHLVANQLTAVMTGSFVSPVALAAAWWGTPFPWIIAGSVVLTMVVRSGIKRFLKGHGYHADELVQDLTFGLARAVPLLTNQLSLEMFGQITNLALESGVSTGVMGLHRRFNHIRTKRYGLDPLRLAHLEQPDPVALADDYLPQLGPDASAKAPALDALLSVVAHHADATRPDRSSQILTSPEN